jgi:hypothetical protein
MKPGTQADLIRHLASEYNIQVSRNAISLLVRGNDYRIHKTPKGKIKIDETTKALVDSGFGERSAKLKRKNGTEKTPETKPKEREPDVDLSQPITIESQRSVIERHKAFHAAEKDRIKNEIALEKLIDVDDVSENSFNLFRQVRDEIQSLKDRTVIKIRAAESEHEAEQVFNKEIHRILNSIVDGYEKLDDSTVKKKLLLRLKPQTAGR